MSTKTWTSKADWDGGTLDDLYCPIDLAQLEIAYDILTGKATYIFDAEKMVNWSGFGYTKVDEATIWRDDFRVDSLARYSTVGNSPVYQAANHRLYCHWGATFYSGVQLPVSLSFKDVKILADFYFTAKKDAGGPYSMVVGRRDPTPPDDAYASLHVGTSCTNKTQIWKQVAGNRTLLVDNSDQIPWNVWRTHHFELNGTSLKSYTDETSLNTTDGSITAAGYIQASHQQGAGYLDNILAEHYTLPSPANNSISVRFAISNNNVDWNPWVTDIGDCGNSRYIKVEVTLERDDLDAAMPVLKDMTLTYETRKQQPIFI